MKSFIPNLYRPKIKTDLVHYIKATKLSPAKNIDMSNPTGLTGAKEFSEKMKTFKMNETIIYKGQEIFAVIEYKADETEGRGQKTVAEIIVSSSDVILPEKEDLVILPNAGIYTVEKILSGDNISWILQLRTKAKAKIGGLK
jgi:hypothetical protein